ncbi:MAG: hypothetical protein M0R77_08725 [Gammaproteobacteria bacterium]|nr:hypothetical protein [Gammaproteobacteria bacterium]
MNRILALSIVSLLSTSAFADNFSGNPDLKTSPLNEHSGAPASAAQPGNNDSYGSVLLDLRDRDSTERNAKVATTQRGDGDSYGSVLLDLGHRW